MAIKNKGLKTISIGASKMEDAEPNCVDVVFEYNKENVSISIEKNENNVKIFLDGNEIQRSFGAASLSEGLEEVLKALEVKPLKEVIEAKGFTPTIIDDEGDLKIQFPFRGYGLTAKLSKSGDVYTLELPGENNSVDTHRSPDLNQLLIDRERRILFDQMKEEITSRQENGFIHIHNGEFEYTDDENNKEKGTVYFDIEKNQPAFHFYGERYYFPYPNSKTFFDEVERIVDNALNVDMEAEGFTRNIPFEDYSFNTSNEDISKLHKCILAEYREMKVLYSINKNSHNTIKNPGKWVLEFRIYDTDNDTEQSVQEFVTDTKREAFEEMKGILDQLIDSTGKIDQLIDSMKSLRFK